MLSDELDSSELGQLFLAWSRRVGRLMTMFPRSGVSMSSRSKSPPATSLKTVSSEESTRERRRIKKLKRRRSTRDRISCVIQ